MKNYLHSKSRLTFKNTYTLLFMKKINFLKVNLETHACLTKNWKLHNNTLNLFQMQRSNTYLECI